MNLNLSTKILGGFSILSIMVLIGGIAGVFGVNQLDKTLDYVTNNAWDAADGAMEGTIGIQQELIAVSQILLNTETAQEEHDDEGGSETGHSTMEGETDQSTMDREDHKSLADLDFGEMLAEAKEFGGEAIERMLASGLIDEALVERFEAQHLSYQSLQDELLKTQEEFQAIDSEIEDDFEEVEILLETAGDMGNAEMEYLSEIPDKKFSWNSGLKDKWQTSHDVSETSIAVFALITHYEFLLRGGEPDEQIGKINELIELIEEEISELAESEILNRVRLGNILGEDDEEEEYTADTPLAVALTDELTQLTTKVGIAIEIFGKVTEVKEAYNHEAQFMLEILEQVEETGDAAVEGQADNIAQTKVLSYSAIAIALVVSLVLALLLTFALTNTIRSAFVKMIQVCNQVAEGELQEIEVEATGDEVQETLEAMKNMVGKLEKENIALNDSVIDLLEAVSDLSDRDLTVKVPVNEDVTGPVADAMNLLASETANVLLEIRNVSEQVADASSRVQEQGGRVNELAANERAIVEDTMTKLTDASKSMTQVAQLAKACNDTAAKASTSTQVALETVAKTASGMGDIRETISETEKRIKRLGERSQEINGVVEIINNIAERTHVLALNASMQAAAAGDAGRGFAVVADEVQRLAESSRQSTSEIAGLVGNIQAETAETMATMNKTIAQVVDGTELAQAAGGQMEETQKTTSELANAVEQIFRRSITQAKVTETLRDQAAQVQSSTEETSSELEQQSNETVNLVEFSKRLVESVGVFKLPA